MHSAPLAPAASPHPRYGDGPGGKKADQVIARRGQQLTGVHGLTPFRASGQVRFLTRGRWRHRPGDEEIGAPTTQAVLPLEPAVGIHDALQKCVSGATAGVVEAFQPAVRVFACSRKNCWKAVSMPRTSGYHAATVSLTSSAGLRRNWWSTPDCLAGDSLRGEHAVHGRRASIALECRPIAPASCLTMPSMHASLCRRRSCA